MSYLNTVKEWLLDPFGIRADISHIACKTSEMQGDIYHSTRRTEELAKLFIGFEARMEEHLFLRQVNKALDSSIPDMVWVKDLEGKYILANEPIRKGLLFDDNPYGKDDRELAAAQIARVGAENHTFGAICGNSDLEVLKQELPMKFNEDGLVSGEYLMLQVHKNVIRDSKGNVIGTAGVGRDITYEVTELTKLADSVACDEVRGKIHEIINHYRFEDRT